MNRTAEPLGASTPGVMARIERFAKHHARKPEPRGRALAIEPDGTRHHLKKKQSRKLGVWKARDRATGRPVDGHRLARFRRRSILVSEGVRLIDAGIALVAAFGGDDEIQDLFSMRA